LKSRERSQFIFKAGKTFPFCLLIPYLLWISELVGGKVTALFANETATVLIGSDNNIYSIKHENLEKNQLIKVELKEHSIIRRVQAKTSLLKVKSLVSNMYMFVLLTSLSNRVGVAITVSLADRTAVMEPVKRRIVVQASRHQSNSYQIFHF
jgi:hypothetical protein